MKEARKMNKKLSMLWVGLFLVQGLTVSHAAERGTPEYEKMKEYKKSQREKKASPAASQEKSFWQKEAERSGLAGTAAMFGNAVAGAIPLDKPNSRKTDQ